MSSKVASSGIPSSSNTVHLITFWWYPVLGAKASPRGHLMNVTTVESTSLATVAYDDARKLLQVEFCSREIYQCLGVPAAVPAALLRAPSKGIYFNRVIRGRFPYSLASNSQAGVAHAALRSERSRYEAQMARTVASLPAGSRE